MDHRHPIRVKEEPLEEEDGLECYEEVDGLNLCE